MVAVDEGSSRGVVPQPDPTLLTTEQLLREVSSLRTYVDGQVKILEERLSGIDTATILRRETSDMIERGIGEKIGHLRELVEEKFESIAIQFKERDTRSERESRDNKVAVDAAFAAQKEAASEQNKSNTLAIDKSEKATAETLNKQSELFKTTTDALRDQVNDLKLTVERMQALVNGGLAQRVETRASTNDNRAIFATIATSVFLFLAVVGFIISEVIRSTS